MIIPRWVFELKDDGFRALAYIDAGYPRLISRNRNKMTRFEKLAHGNADELKARQAILDGEIVCVDKAGRPMFKELFHKRGEPVFYAFDLLWLDGQDFRGRPLAERKAKLKKLIPARSAYMGYVTHWAERGKALFEEIKKRDLEGIIAKRADAPYQQEAIWYKIKNPNYTQGEGRSDLFDRLRSTAGGSQFKLLSSSHYGKSLLAVLGFLHVIPFGDSIFAVTDLTPG